MRIRKFFQIHSVQRSSWLACIYLKNGSTSTDNHLGAFDSNNRHFQPFSRFSSLLNFARIFLPVTHLFAHSKIRRKKLHSFGKISSDVFSLLYLEMCLHSQFLISSWRRSCLVGVDASCSGFMEAGSMRSLGILPMANSIGVFSAPYSEKKLVSTRKNPFVYDTKKALLRWLVGRLVGWSVRWLVGWSVHWLVGWLVGPSVGPSMCWCPQPDRPKYRFCPLLWCVPSLFGLLLECFPLFQPIFQTFLQCFWPSSGVTGHFLECFPFFFGHFLECFPLGLPSLGVFSWRHGGAKRTRTTPNSKFCLRVHLAPMASAKRKIAPLSVDRPLLDRPPIVRAPAPKVFFRVPYTEGFLFEWK